MEKILVVDIKNILLDITPLILYGLIVNKLVSNSLKYAFPGKRRKRDVNRYARYQYIHGAMR
jgi:two-component sensor histidine kinase